MFRRLRNKRLYKKWLKAPSIYAVGIYSDWCAIHHKFAGKWEWDERCKEWVPLVYEPVPPHGGYGYFRVVKLTDTLGPTLIGWTFNRDRAEAWVYEKKILEEVNYGKVFNN